MEIRLFTLSKKTNSTLRPAGNGRVVSIQIKSPCSILNPTLEGATYYPENYCFIPLWNRYYFINEKTYINGAWTYSLSVDTLATYRTEIGSTSMFVLRSSASFDGSLIDSMYPLKAENSMREMEFGELKSFRQGYFVISVIGANSNNGGEIIYQMGAETFQSILTELLLYADGRDWTDVPEGAKLSVMNPTQYITSCRWYPYPFDVRRDANDQPYEVSIQAGLWRSTTLVNIVSSSASSPKESYILNDLPKHPQADTLGVNMNLKPYSRYILELGVFGCIELDPSLLVNCGSLQINIFADQWTGMGKARVLGVYSEDGYRKLKLLATLEHKYGVDIPLSASQGINPSDVLSTVVGAVSFVSGFASLGTGVGLLKMGAGAGAVAHGITSMESSMNGISVSAGSVGAMLDHQIQKRLYVYFNTRVVGDRTNDGRPLMEVHTPASLGGYMLMEKGLVQLSASETESDEVNRFMVTGFYYE